MEGQTINRDHTEGRHTTAPCQQCTAPTTGRLRAALAPRFVPPEEEEEEGRNNRRKRWVRIRVRGGVVCDSAGMTTRGTNVVPTFLGPGTKGFPTAQ